MTIQQLKWTENLNTIHIPVSSTGHVLSKKENKWIFRSFTTYKLWAFKIMVNIGHFENVTKSLASCAIFSKNPYLVMLKNDKFWSWQGHSFLKPGIFKPSPLATERCIYLDLLSHFVVELSTDYLKHSFFVI